MCNCVKCLRNDFCQFLPKCYINKLSYLILPYLKAQAYGLLLWHYFEKILFGRHVIKYNMYLYNMSYRT